MDKTVILTKGDRVSAETMNDNSESLIFICTCRVSLRDRSSRPNYNNNIMRKAILLTEWGLGQMITLESPTLDSYAVYDEKNFHKFIGRETTRNFVGGITVEEAVPELLALMQKIYNGGYHELVLDEIEPYMTVKL